MSRALWREASRQYATTAGEGRPYPVRNIGLPLKHAKIRRDLACLVHSHRRRGACGARDTHINAPALCHDCDTTFVAHIALRCNSGPFDVPSFVFIGALTPRVVARASRHAARRQLRKL